MRLRVRTFTHGAVFGVLVGLAVAEAAARYSQQWFHTPQWLAGEAEASADIAAGRTTYYDSDEAFAAALADPPMPAHAAGRVTA